MALNAGKAALIIALLNYAGLKAEQIDQLADSLFSKKPDSNLFLIDSTKNASYDTLFVDMGELDDSVIVNGTPIYAKPKSHEIGEMSLHSSDPVKILLPTTPGLHSQISSLAKLSKDNIPMEYMTVMREIDGSRFRILGSPTEFRDIFSSFSSELINAHIEGTLYPVHNAGSGGLILLKENQIPDSLYISGKLGLIERDGTISFSLGDLKARFMERNTGLWTLNLIDGKYKSIFPSGNSGDLQLNYKNGKFNANAIGGLRFEENMQDSLSVPLVNLILLNENNRKRFAAANLSYQMTDDLKLRLGGLVQDQREYFHLITDAGKVEDNLFEGGFSHINLLLGADYGPISIDIGKSFLKNNSFLEEEKRNLTTVTASVKMPLLDFLLLDRSFSFIHHKGKILTSKSGKATLFFPVELPDSTMAQFEIYGGTSNFYDALITNNSNLDSFLPIEDLGSRRGSNWAIGGKINYENFLSIAAEHYNKSLFDEHTSNGKWMKVEGQNYLIGIKNILDLGSMLKWAYLSLKYSQGSQESNHGSFLPGAADRMMSVETGLELPLGFIINAEFTRNFDGSYYPVKGSGLYKINPQTNKLEREPYIFTKENAGFSNLNIGFGWTGNLGNLRTSISGTVINSLHPFTERELFLLSTGNPKREEERTSINMLYDITARIEF